MGEIELYFEVEGKGTPLVFVHGWTGDHEAWRHQVSHFSKKYRTIVYDQRGHGKSPKPAAGYSISILAEDLHSLVGRLGLSKFVLVGHSMGGMVAQVYALTHPERVEKLVLVGTLCKVPRMAMGILLPFSLLLRSAYKTYVSATAKFGYYRPTPELVAYAKKAALLTPPHVASKLLQDISRFDVSNQLPKLRIPSLIVAGERDLLTRLGMVEFLAKRIKKSELCIIPKASHTVMLDQPELFNKELERFLSGS